MRIQFLAKKLQLIFNQKFINAIRIDWTSNGMTLITHRNSKKI